MPSPVQDLPIFGFQLWQSKQEIVLGEMGSRASVRCKNPERMIEMGHKAQI
jgi:hypothetical protein